MNDRIDKAIEELREGNYVLVHDNSGRENEVDMLVAAEKITPAHVATMRGDGGGLICVALGRELADRLGIPYMVDILGEAKKKYPLLNHTIPDDIPYDEKSSFSLTVNHRNTFTGITDRDRAHTIKKLADFFKGDVSEKRFGLEFRSPGHVHLLISSGLEFREGHTELTTALVEMSGLIPVACICEMMDSKTHKALTAGKAQEYAKKNNMVFLEAGEIKETRMV
ncbi:MAG: 3,4-dihydroxy-2-butanone-4-phosphate synthase [Candidatus Altiarchaeales archaeon ex4484_2]|nr:MAG: 3,4-dihydroxy-2-butanone-4-phosphate synthase [Candidatus Altiarchaeales archaeon ex4484_2]